MKINLKIKFNEDNRNGYYKNSILYFYDIIKLNINDKFIYFKRVDAVGRTFRLNQIDTIEIKGTE